MFQKFSLQSRVMALAAMLATLLIFGAPQSWAAETHDGIPNFGRVTDHLFRGAQPSGAGFQALRDMGVSIVVDFRHESDKIARERGQVEALGMKFVSIPWEGHDDPSSAQVAEFLDLVRANPDAKIFVHCKAGKDRTGVMVASYRIAVERKSVSEAVQEMHDFKYHNFTLPHLKRYVKSLPGLLESEKVFRTYSAKGPVMAAPATVTAKAAAAAPIAGPAAAPTASAPGALTPAARPALAQ